MKRMGDAMVASVRAYAKPTALGDSKEQEADSVPSVWIRHEVVDE